MLRPAATGRGAHEWGIFHWFVAPEKSCTLDRRTRCAVIDISMKRLFYSTSFKKLYDDQDSCDGKYICIFLSISNSSLLSTTMLPDVDVTRMPLTPPLSFDNAAGQGVLLIESCCNMSSESVFVTAKSSPAFASFPKIGTSFSLAEN